MATASRSTHILPGQLGELFVDVRAAGRSSPRPAVVIVHGFKGFKDWGMFPPFAERLARAGVTAVSFNMSGSGVDARGESTLPERFARNTLSAELGDLATMLDSLAAGDLGVAPPSSVGLVGHSRGGGIAVLQAASDRRVRALVTWAAVSAADRWDAATRTAWRARGTMDVLNARTGQIIAVTTDLLDDVERNRDRLDILGAAGRISVPWLIVHGMDDDAVPVADGEALYAAARAGTARLLRLEGTGHTFGSAHPWQPPVPAAERLFDTTVEFLAGALQ